MICEIFWKEKHSTLLKVVEARRISSYIYGIKLKGGGTDGWRLGKRGPRPRLLLVTPAESSHSCHLDSHPLDIFNVFHCLFFWFIYLRTAYNFLWHRITLALRHQALRGVTLWTAFGWAHSVCLHWIGNNNGNLIVLDTSIYSASMEPIRLTSRLIW